MEIKKALVDLYWTPAALDALPGVMLSLLTAAILALLLAQVYIRFGSSFSNRRRFARNFLPLAVTTALIITIVKSSLALSLGLVGALSIVRFRSAIKEPEELAFLFLAIAVGLGLGAGQGLITVAALVVILGLIALRSLVRKEPAAQPNLFLTVTHPDPAGLSTARIMEQFSAAGIPARLNRFDETPELLSASFKVNVRNPDQLQALTQALRRQNDAVEISCLEDQGINA